MIRQSPFRCRKAENVMVSSADKVPASEGIRESGRETVSGQVPRGCQGWGRQGRAVREVFLGR